MAKIKVMAVAHSGRKWAGYYNNRRIRDGEVFMVEEAQFSDVKTHKVIRQDGSLAIKNHRGWMKRLDDAEPNKVTKQTIQVTAKGANVVKTETVLLEPEDAAKIEVKAEPSKKPRRASDESIE